MTDVYQPSPFMMTYGVNANTAGPRISTPTTDFGFTGQASNILSGDRLFNAGLDAMRLGQPQAPSGSYLSNLQTRWGMSDFANGPFMNSVREIGSGINNLVQEKGGGWGNVLGGLSSLMELYTGWKSLGLEQDKFDFSKDAWNKQYEATVKDYENRLRDRWTAKSEVARLRGIQAPTEEAFLAERRIGG